MPIRPENKSRYPADWKKIRQRILARAGDRCEWCGVRNSAIGVRDAKGVFHEMGGDKVIRIVLTIAHVYDRNPENCAEENLAALCQLCHNRHDLPERIRNRRLRELSGPNLFEPESSHVR